MGNIVYSFKEICDKTGYKPSVIRYYEKEFKLEIPRDVNARRTFTQKELDDLLFIKQLQAKGYSNSQIKKILDDRNNSSIEEIAVTREEEVFIQVGSASAVLLEDNMIKLIDERLKQINNNISELSQTVTSKERDIIISENLKLKMEIKQKSFEIMQLKEKLSYEKQNKGGFFSKLFGK
jgi:DNA-binding transcriptional MerR regulator